MAWKLKRGDEVYVISGDDKGAKGRITQVDRKNSRVHVEGVNLRSRHVKVSMQNPEGGVVQKQSSIHISNVALAHEHVNASGVWSRKMTTKVGFAFVDGKKIRSAKRDGSNLGAV